MIASIFTNKIKFTIVFYIILLTDVFVKMDGSDLDYRYLTKPLVLLSLIAFYYINIKNKNKKIERNVMWALCFFLLGDIFLLNYSSTYSLLLSILFFAVGKVFFCLKFKSKEDFEFSGLFPFSIITYIFITIIISIVYENLRLFLVPGLLTLFVSLMMLNLAYLRKVKFSKFSYLSVLLGCILFVFSEGLNAISVFNGNLVFPTFLVMLFYGTAIYLIVLGIVKEKKKKRKNRYL